MSRYADGGVVKVDLSRPSYSEVPGGGISVHYNGVLMKENKDFVEVKPKPAAKESWYEEVTYRGRPMLGERHIAWPLWEAGLIYAPYIPLFTCPTIKTEDLLTFRYNREELTMFGRGRSFNILLSEVRDALTKNRVEHLEIVEEAQEGFKKKVVEELERALEDAKKGKRYQTSFNLSMPQSQLREFDNAIEFLEAIEKAAKSKGEENPTIEMTSEEYERFVRNKWDWMQTFVATSARYSKKAQILHENQN